MNSTCAVCHGEDSEHGNLIVICERCDVGFHQRCYGVGRIPEGEWLCDWCVRRNPPKAARRCDLCATYRSVGNDPTVAKLVGMKQTAEGTGLVHMECAIWLPDVQVVDNHRLGTVVSGVPEAIARAGGKVRTPPTSCCIAELVADVVLLRIGVFPQECIVCHTTRGVCLPCAAAGCPCSMHVSCAMMAGLSETRLAHRARVEGANLEAYMEVLCPTHHENGFTAMRKSALHCAEHRETAGKRVRKPSHARAKVLF